MTEASPSRLVSAPVFLLSSVRSGSTLLRAVLNSHSQVCAPFEVHMKDIGVELRTPFAELSTAEAGLDTEELEHLLWDRLMHRQLAESGKRILVSKTPTNVFVWRRIRAAWPQARYVFLLRHPAAVAASWDRAQVHWTYREAVEDVAGYVHALDEARRELPGLTLSYEELTASPAETVQRVCRFLGVPWEPGMLRYGEAQDAAAFAPGLGDWSENIRSGRPQPARPLPTAEETPAPLRAVSRQWGYL